jgi:hypothetical protein
MSPTSSILVLLLAAAACTDNSKAGGCPALTKPKSGGTMHSYPDQSPDDGTVQVWKAEDSPHFVATYELSDIELTIEPCAYVVMEGPSSITVSRSGKLIAVGTSEKPIAIDSDDPSVGWDTIETRYVARNGETEDTIGGYIQMAYVTLSDGGNTSTGSKDPMIWSHGLDANVTNLPPNEHLDLQHVTVQRGSSYGIVLDRGATFSSTSTDLTIKDQKIAPLQIGFRNLDAVPAGSYTGNTQDLIEVAPDVSGLKRNVTVHQRGVPYLFGEEGNSGRFTVGLDAGAPATLTIEPGVTMQFRPRNVLEIAKTGTLVARGTAADPIVFTSSAASPAPGDWTGIQFLDVPSASSVIDHAQVMYAGDDYQSAGSSCSVEDSGARDSYAAISFAERPATALVTNTAIAHSLHDGIGRVWNGAPLDFAPTNTFTSNAGCAQSFPVPSSNVCPQPVPCD